MNLSGAEIAAATGGVLRGGDHVGPIGTDTRSLVEGAWFVALQGPRFDGHDHAEAARKAGAGGAVFSRPVPGWTKPWVQVDDTTTALQDLGRAARDRLVGPVVGVAGSAGKTTTRAMVACALLPLGKVVQTAANLNNHLGVPLTLLGADERAAATVVELGTSAPGEIALLADIARPDVRVVVNVGPEHLEGFGDLAGVAAEETTLLRTARASDISLVNVDDPWLVEEQPRGRVVRWGVADEADVRLVDVAVDGAGWQTHFTVSVAGETVEATVPSPGRHLAHNAAAALAVAWALDVPLRAAAEALSQYQPVGMRLAPVRWPGPILAINDAYNANPPSVFASLDTLLGLGERRVAVLGDMLELGSEEAELHRQTVAHADALGLDLLVLIGPRMHAAAGVATKTLTWSAADGLSLAADIAEWLAPGDAILFKGSRSARVERVLAAVEARRIAL